MMRICGHTMGTPEYTLDEAILLFKKMSLDGIEIIVQSDGYNCAIPAQASDKEVIEIRTNVRNAGLDVAGITPYLNLYNSLDEAVRIKECNDLKRVIEITKLLNAHFIRIYGGKFVDGEADPDGRKLEALTISMRDCGDYALKNDVKLCMENHFGTMTTNARETAQIASVINHPAVGILYDQANIAFFPAEDYEDAIEIQKDKIFFVHCKDLVYRNGVAQKPKFDMVSHINENDRTVHSRIPGEGILNWPGIISKLKAIGYDGWISLEYERRWQKTDLPDASIGMARGAEYIRRILET